MAKLEKFIGDPWEQQPGETPRAFAAFRVYRDLGAVRSLNATAKAMNRGRRYLDLLCSQWLWVRRCEEYDRDLDRQHRARMAEHRRKMAEEHMVMGRYLRTAGAVALRKKFGDQLELIDATTMEVVDALKCVNDGVKAERVAVGEPGEIIESQVTGGVPESDRKPVVPASYFGRVDEALALLEAARARAAGDAPRAED